MENTELKKLTLGKNKNLTTTNLMSLEKKMLEDEINFLKQKVNNINNEKELLKSKIIHDENTENLGNSNLNESHDRNNLKEENHFLKDQINNLAMENNELKNSSFGKNTNLTNLEKKNYEDEINFLKNKINSINEEKIINSNPKQEEHQDSNHLYNENNYLKDQINNLISQNESIALEKQNLLFHIDLLKKELTNLESENYKIKNNSNFELENHALKQKIEDLENNTFETKKSTQSNFFKSIDFEKARQEEEYKVAIQMVENLKNENDLLKEKIDKSENDKFSQKNNELSNLKYQLIESNREVFTINN